MNPTDVLNIGNKYSKKELSNLLEQPTLSSVREGVFSCQNSNSYLLFVDLEKQEKEERFHFDDFFEEDFFHWDSQTTQHIESPKIQEIVNGDRTPHLFVRVVQKVKNITQPFVYCGRLEFKNHEVGTSKPVHIIFQNIDYDDFTENEDLIGIYFWNPCKVGKSTKSKISKKGEISRERQTKYKKPNETERKGLVVSRVGQGYYRQQLIEKWKGQCPVTGISIKSILISSHIVPWSESNDMEKLDVDNGILLSPNVDSLFDGHLITFNDDGSIVISKSIPKNHIDILGLSKSIHISVTDGMIPYLKKHRERFLEKENNRSFENN
jgi:hypothetical protein